MELRTYLKEGIIVNIQTIELLELFISAPQQLLAILYGLHLPEKEKAFAHVKLTFDKEDFYEALKHVEEDGVFGDYFIKRLRSICEN